MHFSPLIERRVNKHQEQRMTRQLLAGLPYPENLDHHFVVDPAKLDLYALDCYRILGEDSLAEPLSLNGSLKALPRDLPAHPGGRCLRAAIHPGLVDPHIV